MKKLETFLSFVKIHLPLFVTICFSGNPIVTHMGYSKNILSIYTITFLIYTIATTDLKMIKKSINYFLWLFCLISIIVIFQKIILGFIAIQGILGYILKIILALTTLLYYQSKKIDFIETYIQLITFLAVISIPFWLINFFGFYGIETEGGFRKSFLIYTSLRRSPDVIIPRNAGMFWEPGAFGGYLILGLSFIALKNRGFKMGPYRKEVLLIFICIISTMSTMGFIALGIIFIIYSFQSYNWGKIIIVPLVILLLTFSYFNLDFLREKIEHQFIEAVSMDENDVNPSRFGAFIMDIQYIKSQPLIGNGLHMKTRYRFHPWLKESFNQGNGLSNTIATWGFPFFLYWLFCIFKFAKKVSHSLPTTLGVLVITNLTLFGEQFLNFPIFLFFFFLPFIYQNRLLIKNKIFILKQYLPAP